VAAAFGGEAVIGKCAGMWVPRRMMATGRRGGRTLPGRSALVNRHLGAAALTDRDSRVDGWFRARVRLLSMGYSPTTVLT
jgi:hypothetical protein